MEKILIFIKHNLSFLWRIIEWINGKLFGLFFTSTVDKVLQEVLIENSKPPYIIRRLLLSDVEILYNVINSQDKSDLKYFNPHGFGIASITKQIKNPSFLPMGVFHNGKLAGYFFLRFFINRKSFVGRLIDVNYRGKGIGPLMNSVMYEISWRMKFRCLSTISRDNIAVVRAHAKNPAMIVLKELQNNYILVEFKKDLTK